MKILQVINSLGTGGAEKLLLDTIPLYREKKIEMDILLLNGKNWPFLKRLQKAGCCNIYHLGLGSVYNPLLIFKIIPYLKKYDIVHVHLFPAQYWVAFAKFILSKKTRLIFTEHNTENRRAGNKLFYLADKFIYARYHTLIAITGEVQRMLKKNYKDLKIKLTVIENGVDIQKIIIAKPINNFTHKTCGDKFLLQVAAFREQKDQPTLIKSLVNLPNHVKLILVGDGEFRRICENLVDELDLGLRVFFLGLRSDIPALLKTADIVVLSSKYEGLSLSSIEGMASGRPFVASNVPGLREIVSGAGVLFEQGNHVQLSTKIQELLDDDDYYQSVANACLNRAKKYDISFMVEQHITLYRSVYEA